VPKNIKIAIIGTNFEELVIRTVTASFKLRMPGIPVVLSLQLVT
jgi:hypothetical protein